MGDFVSGDWLLPFFDAFTCGLDGKFKTERLLPGQYAIIVFSYPPMTFEQTRRSDFQLPAFVGRTVVTVHESGEPPQVTIELKPRNTKPPAKPSEDARTNPSKPIEND